MPTPQELENQVNELNAQLQQRQNEIFSLQNNFNNERTTFNNQIGTLQGQINDLSNQLQSKQTEVINQQSNFNNERSGLNSQIASLQGQLNDYNNQKQVEINNVQSNFNLERNNFTTQIGDLNNQLQQKNSEIQTIRTGFDLERANLQNQTNTLAGQINQKDNEIQKLEAQIKEKNEEIINRLSQDYSEYANNLIPQKSFWLDRATNIFYFLGFVIVLSIYSFIKYKNLPIEIRVSFFAVDIVLISYLWFCISQYSYYTKLHTDYENRRVVANSYLGVITNTNDHEIKNEATKIIAETLFSRSSIDMGSELPIKEAVKIVSDGISRK